MKNGMQLVAICCLLVINGDFQSQYGHFPRSATGQLLRSMDRLVFSVNNSQQMHNIVQIDHMFP